MLLQIGAYKLEIDLDKTRKINVAMGENDCACNGCKNYRAFANTCTPTLNAFFQQLGITDLKYIAEIMPFHTTANGLVFYGGFYHLCGCILNDIENDFLPITEQFNVSFSRKCDLLPKTFPRPAIQLNISAQIPWIIDEPNDY